MKKFLSIFAVICLSVVNYGKENNNDCFKSKYAMSDEKRLIKDLLNNYKNVGIVGRPVSDSFQKIVVKYLLELIQILDLDEKNQVLTINVWARYVWKDELLTWDPAKYSNVTKIRVPSDQIWTPDIVLYNYADERLKEHRKVMIVVEYTGDILWVPPAIYKSSCKIDITNFPFDQQGCHLKFGSWTYDGTQLDIQFLNNQSEVNTDVYTKSNEWEIIAKPGKRNEKFYLCCPEPYPDITFFLFLKRNPAFFTYLLLLPCVLLSSLTLVIFWLPPESPAKMVLGMNIFVAFFLLLLLLADSTPSASATVPYIGFYYCLNMILITMSTFCSVIVINLYFRGDNKIRVPSWLKKVIVKIGFVLLMDTSNIMEKKEKIKIIKSEIKYNRKFSKKVGFKFSSNHKIYRQEAEYGDHSEIIDQRYGYKIGTDQIGYRTLNTAESDIGLKNVPCEIANSRPITIHTNIPDYLRQDNKDMNNQYNYATSSEDQNAFNYCNNGGSIRYRLEDNRITITEDTERGINFSHLMNDFNQSSPVTPQMESVILKFSQPLENDVTEIRKGIRTLMTRMADIDYANKRASEWRTVALVLDRIFFWIFISTIIISGLVLLLPKGPNITIEEMIRQHTPEPKNATITE